ncbi:hypothetical protein B0J11DRAFT_502841 [Dendryphion nanum]|uniref:FAD-binding PCMH-type domain-containing protein n=1 Tax=Dendryphion nanum TaxID=256645 RepID=A0A9P9EDU1_9PLEO|nr:hypothetical protein B0J11DRAFT_502841 [Dendryphion nanum]
MSGGSSTSSLLNGLIRLWLCLAIFLQFSIVSSSDISIDSVCRTLSTALPNKVFFPDNTLYKTSIQSYFFRQSRLSPNCVIGPTSAEDVSQAVKILTANSSVKFAVRAGGHSVNTAASNIANGITIDLSRMRDINPLGGKWDVVEIGAGAKSIDAYRVLDKHNRTVVGGRVGSVGLAGFLTGGGLSFFSPEHGFGCDTIQNMQVVLSSGEIVNANPTSNPELFRALKGGQNNFGIVTRFDLRTFPQTEFWGGAIQYPPRATTHSSKHLQNSRVPTTTIHYSNNMFYTKPVVNASGLDYFTKIQPQMGSTMRISNTTDFANELDSLQPSDLYSIYATTTFAITPTILKKAHTLWKQATTSLLATTTNLTSVLTYQALPPPPPATNPNSMPFPPTSSPHTTLVLGLVSIYWPLESDSAHIHAAVKTLLSAIEQVAKKERVLVEYKYLNYATALWQKPIRSYGMNEFRMLKKIARTYDPGEVFQRQVPGGFKLEE